MSYQPGLGAPGYVAPAAGSFWTPEDLGFLAWSEDPMNCQGAMTPTLGTVYLQRMKMRTAKTIASLNVVVVNTGAPTSLFAIVYDASLNRVAVSANLSASVSSLGEKALAVTYAAPDANDLYGGILVVGGTAPNLARGNNTIAQIPNAGTATPNWRSMVDANGSNTTAPNPLPTPPVAAFVPWMAFK